jgi:hypothetical protein
VLGPSGLPLHFNRILRVPGLPAGSFAIDSPKIRAILNGDECHEENSQDEKPEEYRE